MVQLQVFDQDLLTNDDPVLSVLFDVGTLRAGEFRRESFSLSAQARLCPGQWKASAQGGEILCRGAGYMALFSSEWSRLPWHPEATVSLELLSTGIIPSLTLFLGPSTKGSFWELPRKWTEQGGDGHWLSPPLRPQQPHLACVLKSTLTLLNLSNFVFFLSPG